MTVDWRKYREKIIGLGENSFQKSYYPDLQEKITELEMARLYLATLINSTSDSILILDLNGKLLFLNDQARLLIKASDKDEKEYNVYDILSDSENTGDISSAFNGVLNNIPRTIEWKIKPLEGDMIIPVQVSLSKTAWYGETAIIAILRDFTERKHYEEELIAAREMAEENDRLKSLFLANLSHEIRTPMNAILGFTEILRSQDISHEEREGYFDIVKTSGEHLLSIINDIIEISRIEAGQAVMHASVTNLNHLLEDVYNSLRITIPKEKSLDIRLLRHDHPPVESIITDEVKLKQILVNLLNNAIKFTDTGHITFGYELIGDNTLKFTVTDTGAGIDSKYQKIIFERFRQADSDLTIKKGGSGLGLAISKAYVELLGGSIAVASAPGKGSVFTFTITFQKPMKQYISQTKESDTNVVKGENEVILIAEDDFYNYLYIEKLVGPNNYNLIRACNGKEAVDYCNKNKNIKLVLMDIKMPVMNGYEALMKIREINSDLPVVAQTAYALPEDLTRIKQEGFDGYLLKPIRKNELFDIIRKYVNTDNGNE